MKIESLPLNFDDVIASRLIALSEIYGFTKIDGSAQTIIAHLTRKFVDQMMRSGEMTRKQLSWRFLVALAGAYPRSVDVELLTNSLIVAHPVDYVRIALSVGSRVSNRWGVKIHALNLVNQSLLVDTDVSARTVHNTGIQRVVRNTCREWKQKGHHFVPTVWPEDVNGYRELSLAERQRLMPWFEANEKAEDINPDAISVILPIGGTLLLMEVPSKERSPEIAALARYSGVRVIILGYDCIPLTSAESVSHAETEKFISYLEIVKNSALVIAISESAAAEFKGFSAMLPTQGLEEVPVVSLPLPVDVHEKLQSRSHAKQTVPLVLCLGSIEPRKNQINVLLAAEKCWESGDLFALTFVGGGNSPYAARLKKRISSLSRNGRKVRLLQGVDDIKLHELFLQCDFTVFVSLHEGYGLPIAESIAYGKPVVVSNYGSMAEVAKFGKSYAVDPLSRIDIAQGIKRALHRGADSREIAKHLISQRTWETYSQELWALVSK